MFQEGTLILSVRATRSGQWRRVWQRSGAAAHSAREVDAAANGCRLRGLACLCGLVVLRCFSSVLDRRPCAHCSTGWCVEPFSSRWLAAYEFLAVAISAALTTRNEHTWRATSPKSGRGGRALRELGELWCLRLLESYRYRIGIPSRCAFLSNPGRVAGR